ncbi:MAG: DUF2157 domain-containing protein [Gammaproteobacteria bacterium]|nr:DUF2157 domain-containing protein [Gammaproteobacteria bacterium]
MTDSQAAPANLAEVNELRHAGEITASQYLGAVRQCRDSDYWHRWAMRALLVLGAVHLLAGVIFFFAYNWDELSSFSKFGLLQSGLVLSFVAAIVLRLETVSGQGMLIASSVFTGVLLAVIGQVYQTGADAWELFAAWTVLTLPWALVSKSSAHWMFWIVICLTAVSLYGAQVMVALGHLEPTELAIVTGVLPIVFLACREAALRLGAEWLDDGWFRRGLVVFAMGSLFFPAIAFVFSNDSDLPGFVVFLLVTAALAYTYMQVLPDFSILAIITAFVTVLGMAIGGRLIHETISFDGSGQLVVGLFLLGGWCAAMTTGAVRFLRYLHKEVSPEVQQ